MSPCQIWIYLSVFYKQAGRTAACFLTVFMMIISGYSYRIAVTLDGPMLPNLGFMFVALVGKYGSSREHQLHV